MSDSLRDQLLKAGLVTKKEAARSERAKQPFRGGKGRNPPTGTSNRVADDAARAAKAARDRELNRQQQAKIEARARRAQLRQIIDQHRVPSPETDEYFNFVDSGKDPSHRGGRKPARATCRRHAAHCPLRWPLRHGADRGRGAVPGTRSRCGDHARPAGDDVDARRRSIPRLRRARRPDLVIATDGLVSRLATLHRAGAVTPCRARPCPMHPGGFREAPRSRKSPAAARTTANRESSSNRHSNDRTGSRRLRRSWSMPCASSSARSAGSAAVTDSSSASTSPPTSGGPRPHSGPLGCRSIETHRWTSAASIWSARKKLRLPSRITASPGSRRFQSPRRTRSASTRLKSSLRAVDNANPRGVLPRGAWPPAAQFARARKIGMAAAVTLRPEVVRHPGGTDERESRLYRGTVARDVPDPDHEAVGAVRPGPELAAVPLGREHPVTLAGEDRGMRPGEPQRARAMKTIAARPRAGPSARSRRRRATRPRPPARARPRPSRCLRRAFRPAAAHGCRCRRHRSPAVPRRRSPRARRGIDQPAAACRARREVPRIQPTVFRSVGTREQHDRLCREPLGATERPESFMRRGLDVDSLLVAIEVAGDPRAHLDRGARRASAPRQ